MELRRESRAGVAAVTYARFIMQSTRTHFAAVSREEEGTLESGREDELVRKRCRSS